MMSSELLWALLLFVVVTLFTPGPNNTMLMASGLNFGFRRGLPHLWGVALGFAAMVLSVGVGLGAVFQAYPAAYTVLKYAGAAYLLYLAWQIATAGASKRAGGERAARSRSWKRAAFQWLNPKGWVMAVGAVSTYAAVAVFPFNVLLMAGLFGTSASSRARPGSGSARGSSGCYQPARRARRECHHGAAAGGSLWPILADAWR